MRLIDADALIAKQASIAKTFAHSDAQKSLMGRVIYNTEKAPTIKAIPVEWLRENLGKYLDDGVLFGNERDRNVARSIWNVLAIWQKEQEA